MRFEEVYGRFQRGRLSCAEAADILGMSERNFLRYWTRYEAQGAEGLYDRRVGRVSGRRLAVDVATRVIELYATMPRATSTRPSSSSRKAPCRASRRWAR